MSDFNLIDEPETASFPARWCMTRDEAATIWYALDAYKKQMVKDAFEHVTNSRVEDQAFAYNIAAQCARLQFEMRDDHSPPEEAAIVRKWLDTE
jgi:hypothetical protein